MAPSQVNDRNRLFVFKTLHPDKNITKRPRLKRGDKVRLPVEKNIFEKGYTKNWTEEIFTIVQCYVDSKGVDTYKLEDSAGNPIPRRKYFYELNLVSRNVD